MSSVFEALCLGFSFLLAETAGDFPSLSLSEETWPPCRLPSRPAASWLGPSLLCELPGQAQGPARCQAIDSSSQCLPGKVMALAWGTLGTVGGWNGLKLYTFLKKEMVKPLTLDLWLLQ